MKKLSIVIFSLLILFIIGQVAFAQNNIELNLRYYGNVNDYTLRIHGPTTSTLSTESSYLGIGISGNLDVNKSFALAGEVAFIINNTTERKSDAGSFILNYYGDIDGKFSAFKSKFINIGFQVGLRYVGYNEKSSEYNTLSLIDTMENSHEISLIIGIYGDMNISKNLSLYTDLKVPVAYVAFEEIDVNNRDTNLGNTQKNAAYGFRVTTLRTTVGMKYNVASGFYIGLELGNSITTSTTLSNMRLFSTLRLNLGYEF